MKKSILILGVALTFPATALLAEAPRGGGGGKGGPGGPPPGHGPGPSHDGDPGEAHDDPHRNPLFHALLHALDTDGDGFISMTEMNHASEALLKLDKNNDGKLSHDELCPGGHGPKDGHPHGPKPDKADKPDPDKDDKAAADKADNPKPPADKDDDKKPRKDKEDGPKAGNPPPPDEHRSALVDAIDKDHDGEISAEEIAGARAALKKLDTNHNGKLGPAEYGGHPHS
jgi:hypothetical protein